MKSDTTLPPSEWIYARWLGWYEYDEENQRVPATLGIYDCDLGYNVFLCGRDIEHLKWLPYREEAIEWGVDAARELAAQHEISECEKD